MRDEKGTIIIEKTENCDLVEKILKNGEILTPINAYYKGKALEYLLNAETKKDYEKAREFLIKFINNYNRP